jgi:hypothetical protein
VVVTSLLHTIRREALTLEDVDRLDQRAVEPALGLVLLGEAEGPGRERLVLVGEAEHDAVVLLGIEGLAQARLRAHADVRLPWT